MKRGSKFLSHFDNDKGYGCLQDIIHPGCVKSLIRVIEGTENKYNVIPTEVDKGGIYGEDEGRYILDNGNETFHIKTVKGKERSITGIPHRMERLVKNTFSVQVYEAFEMMKKALEITSSIYLCGSFVLNEIHGLGSNWEDLDFAVYTSHKQQQEIINLFKTAGYEEVHNYTQSPFGDLGETGYNEGTNSVKFNMGMFNINLILHHNTLNQPVGYQMCEYNGFRIIPFIENIKAKASYSRDKDISQINHMVSNILSTLKIEDNDGCYIHNYSKNYF